MSEETRRLRDAIKLILFAFDNARLVPKPGCGVGGQTIEANIKGSVYNGVDAWPIEEARAVLDCYTSDRVYNGVRTEKDAKKNAAHKARIAAALVKISDRRLPSK